MKVKFRMDRGAGIRDGSGRFACPNLYCWRENMTCLKPPTVENYIPPGYDGYKETVEPCSTCGVEIDWSWIIYDLQANNRRLDSSKK